MPSKLPSIEMPPQEEPNPLVKLATGGKIE